jgi:hypothetical protein
MEKREGREEWKKGGCHCGAVRFEAKAGWDSALLCNCSICEKKGFLHVIVPKDRFRLKSGDDALQSYRFATRAANHLFCRHCGIASFYVPRSHPDGYSVNLRCVEGVELSKVRLEPFDGKNWERARKELRD